MPCYHPIPVWPDLKTGEYLFRRDSRRELGGEVLMPCRQCIGCRADHVASWKLRLTHEAHCHERACFVTLTFDDWHFPESQEAWERAFVLFVKRLRKASRPLKLRTYGCLELGDETRRPHGHLLIFGRDFSRDEPMARGEGGSMCYRSDELDALWTLGHASVGNLTEQSAGYVAGYTLKKRSARDERGDFELVEHPRTGEMVSLSPARSFCCSRRPGIGAEWFRRYGEQATHFGYIYGKGGSKAALPDYYKRLGKRAFGNLGSDAAAERSLEAYRHIADTTPERCDVREQVHAARDRFYKKRGVL